MPRVLVISSTDLSADLGRTVLWRSGVEHSFASDEAAGCQRARSWGPNLIVVDGTERDRAERTVRRLRGDTATRQAAIAVLSRTPFLADAGDFRRAGANAVLPPETSPSVWDVRLQELLSVPRRREARIPVQLELWSRAGNGVDAVDGRTLNISVNGLLLEASCPLDIGQKLDLRFRLPGRDEEFQAVGEVVRHADASRRGIRFLVLRGEARDAIGAFVEAGTAASGVASGAPKTAPAAQDEIWHTELRALETLRAAILESSVDSVVIVTHEGRIVDISRAAERTLGYRREELVGSTIAETIAPPSDRDPQRQFLTFGLATASPLLVGQRIEMTVQGAGGREVPVELTTTATPVKGRPLFTVFLRDLTDAIRAQRLDAAARRITDASAVAQGLDELCQAIHLLLAPLIAVRSVTIALRDASSGELTVPYRTGAAEQDVTIAQGRKAFIEHVLRTGRPYEAPSGAVADPASSELLSAAQGAEQWFGVPLEKHGHSFGVVAIERGGPARAFTDEDRRTLTLLSQPIAVALDRKQAETKIHYLAYHDALTGLPNRHLLLDRLQLGIAQATRDRNHLGVLLVDIDRFNVINDSLGHSIGDRVVKEAATRLSRHIRKGDTLARMGADEFAVVIRGLRNPPDAAKVAQILQGSLADPLEVGGRELFVTACVGISIFPDDGTDLETLLKNADTALHRAKEQGHDSFRLYDPSMNAEAVHRLKLEHGLRRALSRDELVTHYQPVVDLTTGEIECVEALLRWRHPEQGILLPNDFISIAETTGMIRAIGSWALKAACVQARAWQEQGHPRLSVAVNLSARQLHHMNVVAEVATALSEAGLSPEALELELTETSAMVDAEATIRTLEALKDLGVRISIDDFGIGYSSMSHLQRLPIDMLKIDRSFVRDITTDADDAAIVLAIINLGHTLKLRIVAEGVETAEQLEFLARHGCDRVQGYVFAHPVPAAECAGVLTAHRAESWRRQPSRTSGPEGPSSGFSR